MTTSRAITAQCEIRQSTLCSSAWFVRIRVAGFAPHSMVCVMDDFGELQVCDSTKLPASFYW